MILAGRYELLGLLGVGGMGSVYRARDRELDEYVAVKVLRREIVALPDTLERFRREVKLSRRIAHPNVARMFDIAESDSERFLTMELVEGESLGVLLRREGRLAADRVVGIALPVCEGLAAAHAAGVVHRDLKPDNVLLARDGRVVLTDFGIARALVSASPPARTLGLAVGTPEYMAPEQADGTPDVDGRADIYALGAMLFEMLSGAPPWSGDSALAIVTARLLAPPPDVSQRAPVPQELAQIVTRCMARRREDRFARIEEVHEALVALRLPHARTPVTRPRRASGRPAAGPRTILVVPPARPVVSAAAPAPLVTPAPGSPRTSDETVLREGFAAFLADALAGQPSITVYRHAEGRRRPGSRDLQNLGREVGAELVLGGQGTFDGTRCVLDLQLVNCADGFVLLRRAFEGPFTGLFDLACEMAEGTARALLAGAPARLPPPTLEPEALMLLLRARHAASREGHEALDDAVSLFERAIRRAPDDAWIHAGYALSLMRRLFELGAPGDEAIEARTMADAAIARVPRLVEAHVALAHALWALGDMVGAARELHVIAALAPAQAEVRALSCELSMRLGDPGRALSDLRAPGPAGPASPRTRWLEAQALGALGQWSQAEAVLDGAPEADLVSGEPWLRRARLAAFRGDDARLADLVADASARRFEDRETVLPLMHAMAVRRLTEDAAAALEERASRAGQATGQRFAHAQLTVEVLVRADRVAEALDVAGEAIALGGFDLTWLDTTPSLAPLRASPRYAPLRARAEQSARSVRAVLDRPYDTLLAQESR